MLFESIRVYFADALVCWKSISFSNQMKFGFFVLVVETATNQTNDPLDKDPSISCSLGSMGLLSMRPGLCLCSCRKGHHNGQVSAFSLGSKVISTEGSELRMSCAA